MSDKENSAVRDTPGVGRQRRHFAAGQKVAIVKRHLLDQVAVSDLCKEYGIQPTQFYPWQKQLFEQGTSAFERKRPRIGAGRLNSARSPDSKRSSPLGTT